jgi:hypothetical protein
MAIDSQDYFAPCSVGNQLSLPVYWGVMVRLGITGTPFFEQAEIRRTGMAISKGICLAVI